MSPEASTIEIRARPPGVLLATRYTISAPYWGGMERNTICPPPAPPPPSSASGEELNCQAVFGWKRCTAEAITCSVTCSSGATSAIQMERP